MDPNEEQDAELEVLGSIFDREFRLLEPRTATASARFEIDIQDATSNTVTLRLGFTHTANYPEEPLIVVVNALEGLTTPNRHLLQQHLEIMAKNSAEDQMPSVFTLCEGAKDWITDNIVGAPVIDKEKEDELAKKFETRDSWQSKTVEVISSKAIGTAVNTESFAEWRLKFIAEKEAKKTKEQLARESNPKMTGRQLFESKTIVVTAESESFWEAEASQLA